MGRKKPPAAMPVVRNELSATAPSDSVQPRSRLGCFLAPRYAVMGKTVHVCIASSIIGLTTGANYARDGCEAEEESPCLEGGEKADSKSLGPSAQCSLSSLEYHFFEDDILSHC